MNHRSLLLNTAVIVSLTGGKMADRTRLLYNGESFEYQLMDVVRMEFPDAVILHNLSLYSAYLQNDTQIDVVVVDSSGIFVLEAKNWKYWIQGTYDDYQWTGKSRDQKVMTVFNPFHQNFIHVRTLRNALRVIGVEPPLFHNFVVLPDGTEIRSRCAEVVNLSMLTRKMKSAGKGNSVDVIAMKKAIKSVVNEV